MTKEIQILTNLPPGTKATGGQRADAKPERWDYLIATKSGRFWWSRSTMCPCSGNDQTDQPDPICSQCHGTGYLYFMPDPRADVGDVDVAGAKIEINDARTAIGIQGWVSGVTYDTQIFERFGKWIFGTAMFTTSRYNRIGNRDRFEARDQTIDFSQLILGSGHREIKVTGNRSRKGLWTRVSKVNFLRSTTRQYIDGTDFHVTDRGTIEWLGIVPEPDVLLSIHASFHPTWIVLDFPYAARDTLVGKKTAKNTVAEQFTQLPMRAVVKLDFLVDQ